MSLLYVDAMIIGDVTYYALFIRITKELEGAPAYMQGSTNQDAGVEVATNAFQAQIETEQSLPCIASH